MSSINSPLTLACGLTIPNRICKAAMTEALSDDYGRPSEKLCKLYEVWSSGGSGLLITGNIQIDRRYVERPGNVCIDGEQSEEALALLKKFAQAGKSSGSKIFAQLGHAGRQSNGMINLSPVSPGNIRLNLPKAFFGDPTALTVEQINDVKTRFVNAAVVCKKCGFDGIQIHSAHGYLLSSFLNPNANNRPALFGADDRYGGSLENRSRLLREVIQSTRAACGPSFAVSVKLNSADFQEGGFAPDEAVQVALMCEELGVDLLEISGGNYEAGIFSDTVAAAKANGTVKASTANREAYFLEYAVAMQKSVKKIPIMVTGGWRTKANMENALANSECAMIGVGRPLCGDPYCPKKLISGEISEFPKYEDHLRTFHWSLQWIHSIPIKLISIINMVSQQAWYYRNIVNIAEKGDADLNIGCFSSYLANNSHETTLAKNIKGDVRCVGAVYKGPTK